MVAWSQLSACLDREKFPSWKSLSSYVKQMSPKLVGTYYLQGFLPLTLLQRGAARARTERAAASAALLTLASTTSVAAAPVTAPQSACDARAANVAIRLVPACQ